MLTPKQQKQEVLDKLEAQIWEAKLDIAVTYPIDHDAIRDLVKDLTPDEIAAIPYLPGRAEYIKEAKP